MAVKIRLSRFGKKKRPFYRIIACDESGKRNGNFIEILGTFNPMTKENSVALKNERISYWLKNGAQPTQTVRQMLKKEGLL